MRALTALFVIGLMICCFLDHWLSLFYKARVGCLSEVIFSVERYFIRPSEKTNQQRWLLTYLICWKYILPWIYSKVWGL